MCLLANHSFMYVDSSEYLEEADSSERSGVYWRTPCSNCLYFDINLTNLRLFNPN